MNLEFKLNAIQGRRESLEIEQYAAELDVVLAEAEDNEDLAREPKARLEVANRKLKALDDAEAKAKSSASPEEKAEPAE